MTRHILNLASNKIFVKEVREKNEAAVDAGGHLGVGQVATGEEAVAARSFKLFKGCLERES